MWNFVTFKSINVQTYMHLVLIHCREVVQSSRGIICIGKCDRLLNHGLVPTCANVQCYLTLLQWVFSCIKICLLLTCLLVFC